jgi:15-cis-phytoene synthase
LRALLAFEADRARRYYDVALELTPMISSTGRPVFLTIVGTYRGLLDEIVARDYRVFDRRVSLPKWRKGIVVLRALAGRVARTGPGRELDPERPSYSESVVPLK